MSYSLEVGDTGANRLQLVNAIYGLKSRAFLMQSGLCAGMRVLELGCGVGTMTSWIAEKVGPSGKVYAVDSSSEQIEIARKEVLEQGLQNVEFVHASADDSGLPEGSFDLIYSRLLLMHVPAPENVIAHAKTLLTQGGVLVSEEASVDSTFCEPPSKAQKKLQSIATEMAARYGCDFNIARRIPGLIHDAGFTSLTVAANQPVYLTGIEKRLEELSFSEVVGRVVDSGMASMSELKEICTELRELAEDPSVLYGLSCMIQVSGIKDV